MAVGERPIIYFSCQQQATGMLTNYYPISFIDNALQIFLANLLEISECRGTVSVWPVKGLHHKE